MLILYLYNATLRAILNGFRGERGKRKLRKDLNVTIVFLVSGPDIPGFLLQPFRKPKRIRTAFSPSQLLKLEHAFEKNHYVVGAERKQLAQALSLTETQVRPTRKANVNTSPRH